MQHKLLIFRSNNIVEKAIILAGTYDNELDNNFFNIFSQIVFQKYILVTIVTTNIFIKALVHFFTTIVSTRCMIIALFPSYLEYYYKKDVKNLIGNYLNKKLTYDYNSLPYNSYNPREQKTYVSKVIIENAFLN